MNQSMHIDQTPESHGSGPVLLFVSVMLWAFSVFFQILSTFTFEDLYTWVYRILSALSVCVVLYINFPKAVEQWKKRKKKKNY